MKAKRGFAYIKANVKVPTIFWRTADVWAEGPCRESVISGPWRKSKVPIVPPLLTSFLTLLRVIGSQSLFLVSHERQRIMPEKSPQDKANSVTSSAAGMEEPEPQNVAVT